MRERDRLIELISAHYDGSPWLDVNIADHLNGITHLEANQNIGDCNSIWQLTYHMMHWRKQNMKRIRGHNAPAPYHNFIIEIGDTSAKAWEKLKADFRKTHILFIEFLATFDEADYDKIYAPNGHTYYEHIQGILVHDAYHLGQIVLLRKLIH
jgi:uncharacterized damage-inducible protein DinB